MSESNIVIYLFRKDLRVADNPVLHHLATADHGFTHLLPLFVFPAQQMEVSGFIKDGSKSPFPEARSRVGGYWRCGPHRARFVSQSVWNLKKSLETLDSGLVLRVGMLGDVVQDLIQGLHERQKTVGAVWMVGEEGFEEHRDEEAIASACEKHGAAFRRWPDEKYLIDDRDLKLEKPSELPDIFTTYRKSMEPLRDKPRKSVPRPPKGSLPPLPGKSTLPPQSPPFVIPEDEDALEEALVGPVKHFVPNMPSFPKGAASAHPFKGGEDNAHGRLDSWLATEALNNYKVTRNDLLGTECSTKLSAYLSQGCITARQFHEALVAYEDGTNSAYENVQGYGKGESMGSAAVRFELLWRDYMRLCNRKHKHKLFRLGGFQHDGQYGDGDKTRKWKSANKAASVSGQDPGPDEISRILERFNLGKTGMGLIDASQRELLHTGYTSNRARQNVAGFLAKHLGIDWRYGAEWYEMMLVDYDVSSNWANWQYVAGVGNDPRGEARIFNPVKQAFDYDKDGSYVRTWVPEISKLAKLENVFQAWTATEEELQQLGLADDIMVTHPVKKIQFSVDGKPRAARRPNAYRRGTARRRGHHGGGAPDQPHARPFHGYAPQGPDGYHNQGYHHQGPDGGRWGYRGRGGGGGGGGGYRGRSFGGARGGGYRGRFNGAPQQQWVQPNA